LTNKTCFFSIYDEKRLPFFFFFFVLLVVPWLTSNKKKREKVRKRNIHLRVIYIHSFFAVQVQVKHILSIFFSFADKSIEIKKIFFFNW